VILNSCRFFLSLCVDSASFISIMIWTIDHSSSTSLREQIVACVHRAQINRDLAVGDPLPPAAELAEALSVDRNTVLAAYRQLRDDGVLEFRRGRGVRVAHADAPAPAVLAAVHALIKVGQANGLDRKELTRLIQELT
jgi:GntR family transcriptional regulator